MKLIWSYLEFQRFFIRNQFFEFFISESRLHCHACWGRWHSSAITIMIRFDKISSSEKGYFHSILNFRSYSYILNEIEFMLLHITSQINHHVFKIKTMEKMWLKSQISATRRENYQNAPMWIALMVVAHIALRCRPVRMWPRPATGRVIVDLTITTAAS